MSLCISAWEFDVAFHRLIEGISQQDCEETRTAWRLWSTARSQMADHHAKAVESANQQIGKSIETLLQHSDAAIAGTLETLIEVYPQYIQSRDELMRLAAGDGQFFLAAQHAAMRLDPASLTIRTETCIKDYLQSIPRLAAPQLNHRRVD